ncbi:uncharacterized protein BBA_09545 [Beauveria bassiana ARSEF 2860]|uniref:Uncharacterized protein n=1 Tax=Beauveria bassiana (strain ARSEF 2860) TaxID=655819 RepID=J5JCA0_BEAB2|nr:uncharacterized protein BBA_09545 [Beauveria bassiana ARSEF 2860]EJP61521.1 hypothetical protein BBA_09545 [Beauveria bassiana ARSEF 2860]
MPLALTSVSPNLLEGPQRLITHDSIPVRTRPFTESSSPIRQQSVRPAAEKRQQRPNMNRFVPLAAQNQDADDALADAEAIAKCAEQFSSGYGKRFAQHLRSTILQHWSAASHRASPAPDHAAILDSVEKTPRTAPLEKTVTFAGVTRAANETQPGNRKITPKDAPRRKAQTPRTNKRVLIRLRKDSKFFDKSLQIQLAIRDKLHLQLADLLDMKETNTGFALTPSTIAIQQKILQNQQLWGPLVGLEIAEKDIEWHTYLIKNFPRTITSWDGTELDYKAAFASSASATSLSSLQNPRASSYVTRVGSSLYHPPTQCQKPKVCGNCGSRSHDLENCETHPTCVGCSGPHGAGSSECFALPKRTAHGSRALSKTEQSYAIQQGKTAYVRWELSKQVAKPVEATQSPMTVQDAPDTEMNGAENHTLTDFLDKARTFLQPFASATLYAEGEKSLISQSLPLMDALLAHYEKNKAYYSQKDHQDPRMVRANKMGWFVQNKYYNLTDETPVYVKGRYFDQWKVLEARRHSRRSSGLPVTVYAAALLLNPSRRAAYIRKNWPTSWVKPAIAAAKELWESNFGVLQVGSDNITPSPSLLLAITSHQRGAELDLLMKDIEVITADIRDDDDFSAFIELPTFRIDCSPLEWWSRSEQMSAIPGYTAWP